MNTFTRGVRNAFRNVIRTFSIVIILGLSIGLALAMLAARAAVEDKITSVKSSIGTNIIVSPAGTRGFMGGGEPLKTEQLSKLGSLPSVIRVAQTLSDRLTSENSNLQSAIEAGTLGKRAAGNSGVGFMVAPGGGSTEVRIDDGSNKPIIQTFTPPVMVTGTNDISSSSVYGGDSVAFTAGQAFDPAKDEDIALVGTKLAEKNNLSAGSTFTAYGKTITVVGIYDAGNDFANAGLVMQLAALQRISDQAGSVTSATATVDSIDNVETVTTAIKDTLGNNADVTNNLESAKQALEPLASVKTISSFSLVGAVAAGAAIILLTMVMIVRERRREIGVFKAIGASNLKVISQFMSEAVTLTFLALIAGLIIGAIAANPVTNVLVNNSSNNLSSQTSTASGPKTNVVQLGGPNGAKPLGGPRTFSTGPTVLRNFGNNTIENAKNVQASVGTEILLYGVATAFIIAIVGSAIPALLISKVRPADVMRSE